MPKRKINLGRKASIGKLLSAPARAYYGAKGKMADVKRAKVLRKRAGKKRKIFGKK